MSNSSKPNNAVGKKFTDLLSNVAQRAKEIQEQQARQAQNGVPDELPKPKTQTVYDNRFEWYWEPLPDFRIIAVLDRELLSWIVDFNVPGELNTFDIADAKKLGEALIAANAWKDIWKEHFADYFVGEKVADLKVVPNIDHGNAVTDGNVNNDDDGERREIQ